MSTVRIGPSRQVTLPADVLEKLDLGEGDTLEAEVREGRLVLTPKSAGMLAPEERKLLQQARRKIARIRKDLGRSKGLTPAEADLAARAGLIQKDQRWWWTEAWQGGERQVEQDLKAGRVKVFESANELLHDLRKR